MSTFGKIGFILSHNEKIHLLQQLSRYRKKKIRQKYIFKKETSEWRVIVQVVFELNNLMAVGMNDLR